MWRAWVLWPKHRPIKTLLASCLCVSLGIVFVRLDYHIWVIDIVSYFRRKYGRRRLDINQAPSHSSRRSGLYASRRATSLHPTSYHQYCFYRVYRLQGMVSEHINLTKMFNNYARLHRKSLKILGDSTTSDCATSIEQILALLVESGLFYCLLWVSQKHA